MSTASRHSTVCTYGLAEFFTPPLERPEVRVAAAQYVQIKGLEHDRQHSFAEPYGALYDAIRHLETFSIPGSAEDGGNSFWAV